MPFIVAFLGAGLGGMLRHGVNLLAAWMVGTSGFPFGTLTINVLGSFLMGLAVEFFAMRAGLTEHWRLFVTTGILGGFTTFSTFSLETALLHERGQTFAAAIYVLASVTVSIGALFAALALFRYAFGTGGA